MNRKIATAGGGIVLFALFGSLTAPAEGTGAQTQGAVVVGDHPSRAPLPEDVAMALSVAQDFTAAHADDLADPWVDPADGALMLGAATSSGRSLAADLANDVATATVRVRIADVARSHATLRAVMDEVIGLTDADVVGASSIYASYVDAEGNRVVVETGAAPSAFVAGLAARYGAGTVGVRVVPGADGGLPALGRNADSTPFWGGANINAPAGGCTSGFPWQPTSTTYGMVTAGHCAPTGGSVSTPASSMGSVASGSRESWTSGTGTVYMTSQSTYRGDVALVGITTGSSGTSMYVGGVNSTSYKPITGMWSRRAQGGDDYCTGGAYSGERCDWDVNWTLGNWKYSTGETARNVSAGSKGGHCIRGGDSGGPVYTATSTSVTAKGIISGAVGYGGSDWYAGTFDSDCRNVFTDIWDVYYGFPGVLRHQ